AVTTSPCTRTLVSPSHIPRSTLVFVGRGFGISTKQPPGLKSDSLPRIKVLFGAFNSTEIEHLTRCHRRRSRAPVGRNISIESDGMAKSQNGFSGFRLCSPICPSTGDPTAPTHFTLNFPLCSPYT